MINIPVSYTHLDVYKRQATGSGKMGHFRKTGTDTLQREPYTGRFKTWVYVADTKERRKAD